MKDKPKVKLTLEQKEAQSILKDVEKTKPKLPTTDKNVLDWSMQELRTYVLHETRKMNPTNKLKWAREFDKRIKEAKELRKKLEVKNERK